MNKKQLRLEIERWITLWYLSWIRVDGIEVDIKSFDLDSIVNSDTLEFRTSCEECRKWWMEWEQYKWEWFWKTKEELLISMKWLLAEKQLLYFVWDDTKEIDTKLNRYKQLYLNTEISNADIFNYVVNVTTKDKKKVAKIVERTMTDKLELDEDRWDRWFNSLKEAEAYANTFNS